MDKRVTIKDIADATGFTAQAVSRALRGMPDISPETTKVIKEKARALGYVKNITAATFRQGRTRIIGILYDHFLNPYFSVMTEYLHETFKRLGYTLMIFTSDAHRLDASVFDFFVSHNLAGVVSFLEPEAGIDELAARYKMPVMVLGRDALGGIDCIRTDDFNGGRLAAERLYAAGCRRILHITETLDISCAKERYDGFAAALKEKGVFEDGAALHLEGKSPEAGLNAFIKAGKSFDGIFAFNDLIALESVYTLRKAGLSGVKVIGFDNVQEDLRLPVRLTTVGFDKRQMAEVAAYVLVHKINHANERLFKKTHEVFIVDGETCP